MVAKPSVTISSFGSAAHFLSFTLMRVHTINGENAQVQHLNGGPATDTGTAQAQHTRDPSMPRGPAKSHPDYTQGVETRNIAVPITTYNAQTVQHRPTRSHMARTKGAFNHPAPRVPSRASQPEHKALLQTALHIGVRDARGLRCPHFQRPCPHVICMPPLRVKQVQLTQECELTAEQYPVPTLFTG
jgi:hypothetical protein